MNFNKTRLELSKQGKTFSQGGLNIIHLKSKLLDLGYKDSEVNHDRNTLVSMLEVHLSDKDGEPYTPMEVPEPTGTMDLEMPLQRYINEKGYPAKISGYDIYLHDKSNVSEDVYNAYFERPELLKSMDHMDKIGISREKSYLDTIGKSSVVGAHNLFKIPKGTLLYTTESTDNYHNLSINTALLNRFRAGELTPDAAMIKVVIHITIRDIYIFENKSYKERDEKWFSPLSNSHSPEEIDDFCRRFGYNGHMYHATIDLPKIPEKQYTMDETDLIEFENKEMVYIKICKPERVVKVLNTINLKHREIRKTIKKYLNERLELRFAGEDVSEYDILTADLGI